MIKKETKFNYEPEQRDRKKVLFKKYQKYMKSTLQKAEFKEPIVILMRRGRKTEFYENATAGEWQIQHTDGKDRILFLDPQYIRTFDYGNDKFTGYICHEDNPLPLPEDPVLTSEITGVALEKSTHDIKEWKAKEIRAQTGLIKAVGGILLIAIAGYILYKMLIKPDPVTAQAAQAVAQVVADNVSQVINRPVQVI